MNQEECFRHPISIRAVQQIEQRAKEQSVPVPVLLRRIEAYREIFWRWKRDKHDISAHYLRKMALDGYDVIYILTGKKEIT